MTNWQTFSQKLYPKKIFIACVINSACAQLSIEWEYGSSSNAQRVGVLETIRFALEDD